MHDPARTSPAAESSNTTNTCKREIDHGLLKHRIGKLESHSGSWLVDNTTCTLLGQVLVLVCDSRSFLMTNVTNPGTPTAAPQDNICVGQTKWRIRGALQPKS